MACSLGTGFANSFAWRWIFAYYLLVTALWDPPYHPNCHLLLGTLNPHRKRFPSVISCCPAGAAEETLVQKLLHAEVVTVKLM